MCLSRQRVALRLVVLAMEIIDSIGVAGACAPLLIRRGRNHCTKQRPALCSSVAAVLPRSDFWSTTKSHLRQKLGAQSNFDFLTFACACFHAGPLTSLYAGAAARAHVQGGTGATVAGCTVTLGRSGGRHEDEADRERSGCRCSRRRY
jgi:hypothetical protein